MSHHDRQKNLAEPNSHLPRGNGWFSNKRLKIGIALLVIGLVVTIWGQQAKMPDDSTDHFQQDSAKEKSEHPMTDSATVPMKVTRWDHIDDPASDGWDTEVFSRAASAQLESLGELITGSDEIEKGSLLPLATASFTCQALLPDDRATVFLDETMRVERASGEATQPSPKHQGTDGLATALATLRGPFHDAENLHCKFKLFEIRRLSDSVTTRQYFSISGRGDQGVIEQHATWSTSWTEGEAGEPPRLQSITVEQFEQARAKATEGTLFSDCTESALSANDSYRAQICHGLNYWLGRSQDKRMTFGHAGLAAGDVNGDGLDDLYLCQEAGLPNQLYIQNHDGTMHDASAEAGVDWLQDSRSALLVDLDNDGDQDLVVAIFGALVLAENDGSGKFHTPILLEVDSDTMSLSAVDYDQDGQLDLYVCVYDQGATTGDSALGGVTAATGGFVYHDANNGGANRLFRNQIKANGDWQFVDVTQESGLDVNNRRWSFAGAWEDFDNDGDQDLYVANDYGRNCLYRNDQGENGTRRFIDIAAAAGTEDSASGMSVTWSDYDRAGQMDAYVSNMFSAAGNRITVQDQFTAGSSADLSARVQRFARGNTLLKNQGGGTFTDTSEASAVTMGRWAWGSKFVDLNNDGWDDLVVANGYVTTDDSGDL